MQEQWLYGLVKKEVNFKLNSIRQIIGSWNMVNSWFMDRLVSSNYESPRNSRSISGIHIFGYETEIIQTKLPCTVSESVYCNRQHFVRPPFYHSERT